ncbi:MAG: FKBP-type peptidyl-prolyl cis-trans isomerase [Candidatus Thermoplasmatota archaeon]|nr:FKBP-type peptidyl-prolyl cis-trans isomerase [Candidatus Thermoplasmatota archaeon]
MEKKIEKGDRVEIEYTGKLEDGTVFESSNVEFTVGEGEVVEGLDKAVEGMEKNEEKSVTLGVGEAFGERREEFVVDFPKDKIPEGMEVEKGMIIELNDINGNKIPGVVEDVKDDALRIDLNHPLAGKQITFDIKIKDVKEEDRTL